jgi:hypothetical protein
MARYPVAGRISLSSMNNSHHPESLDSGNLRKKKWPDAIKRQAIKARVSQVRTLRVAGVVLAQRKSAELEESTKIEPNRHFCKKMWNKPKKRLSGIPPSLQVKVFPNCFESPSGRNVGLAHPRK